MDLERISIVVPVLNEEKQISRILDLQSRATNVEIIIVDGGSHDRTVDLAVESGAKIIHSDPGRAMQMNAGAALATGEILLFLHADTQLPDQFDAMIRATLVQSKIIAGAFTLQIALDLPGIRTVERGVNWRSRYLQFPYGDQAIFLRAQTFVELGGFPALPIMEDFELVRRLRRSGKIKILPAAVVTSGRRWQKFGVWQTTIVNQLVIVAYLFGVSPNRLKQWYHNGLKR